MDKTNKEVDFLLLITSFILVSFGLLILASASAPFAQKKMNDSFYFLKHQFLWGLTPGFFLAIFFFKIKLEFLKKISFLLFFLNFLTLAMLFVPSFGVKIGGAVRWLSFKYFVIQPSEFLKIIFIIYLSAWLSNRFSKNKNFSQNFLAFLIIISFLSLFLIFQPDIGTLVIILTIAFFAFFLSHTPIYQNLLIIILGILSITILIYLEPYRLNRLKTFLEPSADPMNKGYQLNQAMMAIGTGGIWGSGLGVSAQKFGLLPNSISDAIFAVFAEETGFFGGSVLFSFFLLFFWRGFSIAQKVSDPFSRLMAFSISLWILLQAFVNISSMVGILPLTGIPLPFVSYGGSHLIAELAGIGILLNISKQKKKNE